MAIDIYKREEQADGQFNGGAILEKKPIGFPQDGGALRPYSNLYYWAHAWSDGGSTIGEHQHQGFEIMSFVLTGKIEHYDSKLKGWKTLDAGDAQIIRAGNGISHAERLHAGSSIFQIWVDPDLSQTQSIPASYDDYPGDGFPVLDEGEYDLKIFTENRLPMDMVTEDLSIFKLTGKTEQFTLILEPHMVYSVFVLKGSPGIGEQSVSEGDFFIAREEDKLDLSSALDAELFMIKSPSKIPYRTYGERYRKA
ncbi:MAG: pirin family protein [Bacteroidales bacterium]|nr:pirin family protein [Bacteroidales bacterium]